METHKKFGLIGKNISYSFSKSYFENKFKRLLLSNHSYTLFDSEDLTAVSEILKDSQLIGLNVTQPYKEKIIPLLDELSPEAEKIGAVNTILLKNGKKTGYNTDAFGFEKSLLLHLKPHHKTALILGNGGAAKAVKYILNQHNISSFTVSRASEINFENLTPKMVSENFIIIQCTPVGTFPDIENCLPFPFEAVSDKHFIIDLIYNPTETTFLKKCRFQGAKTLNGLYMLEQQAEKAWEIWNF